MSKDNNFLIEKVNDISNLEKTLKIYNISEILAVINSFIGYISAFGISDVKDNEFNISVSLLAFAIGCLNTSMYFDIRYKKEFIKDEIFNVYNKLYSNNDDFTNKLIITNKLVLNKKKK